MIIWGVAVVTIYLLFNLAGLYKYKLVFVLIIASPLVPAIACQLILFTTKLLPVVCEKLFPKAQTTSVTNATLQTTAITTEDS